MYKLFKNYFSKVERQLMLTSGLYVHLYVHKYVYLHIYKVNK